MTRAVRLLVPMFLVVLAGPTAAQADNPPTIQVRFAIADASYKLRFSPSQLSAIEAAAAARVAERLGMRIGFFRFTTSGGPNTVLALELNRQDPGGTSNIREVGFHITLQQQGHLMRERAYVMFRSQSESLAPIPGHEALIEAIGPKIAEAAAPKGRITALLSQISIAQQAVVVQNPLGWVIPYRHDDLCMDEASLVLLKNTVDLSTASSVNRDFTARTSGRATQGDSRGRILSEPHPIAQDHLEDFRKTPLAQIRVDAVHVVQYSPRTPCDTVVAPASPPRVQP